MTESTEDGLPGLSFMPNGGQRSSETNAVQCQSTIAAKIREALRLGPIPGGEPSHGVGVVGSPDMPVARRFVRIRIDLVRNHGVLLMA